MKHTLKVIGSVCPGSHGFELRIKSQYRAGLSGLSEFSHAIVCWLADRATVLKTGADLLLPPPYTSKNDAVGVFASRSPARPNPIGLSVIAVTGVDEAGGIVVTPFIDTLPNTPLVDIKPYFPASDRAETAIVPEHFSHWPACLEESASFDWASEFR